MGTGGNTILVEIYREFLNKDGCITKVIEEVK